MTEIRGGITVGETSGNGGRGMTSDRERGEMRGRSERKQLRRGREG